MNPADPSPLPMWPPGHFAAFGEALLQEQARERLRRLGHDDLAAKVIVRWNPRLKTTAGLAHIHHSRISLNPGLIPFGMEEVERTLLHELAHLLARHRAGRRRIEPHGREWRQACADLGLPGEARCHDLPLPRRKVARRLLYRCRSCGKEVWRVRPFTRPVACLACCRMFNHGRFHDRYRLVQVETPPEEGVSETERLF